MKLNTEFLSGGASSVARLVPSEATANTRSMPETRGTSAAAQNAAGHGAQGDPATAGLSVRMVRSSVDLPLDATARGRLIHALKEFDEFMSGLCVGATFGIAVVLLLFVLLR